MRDLPRSAESDRRMLRDVILPHLGRRKVADLTHPEVVKLHQSLTTTPCSANRVLALPSKMFNLAERWGVRTEGTNPCRFEDKLPEKRRERAVSGPAEAAFSCRPGFSRNYPRHSSRRARPKPVN
jgi:hypothetical protein